MLTGFRRIIACCCLIIPFGLQQTVSLCWNDAPFSKKSALKTDFIGASDGGMVAQIYVQNYPRDVGGMILISTGGMDENTLKSLKRKYRLAPVMLCI